MMIPRIVSALAIWAWTACAWALQLSGPLMETQWLSEKLNDPGIVILDVRSDPANFDKQPDPKAKPEPNAPLIGHIPSARVLDWKKVREDREIGGVKLEGMVPLKANFEKTMQSLGVNSDSAVVVVSNFADSANMAQATRLYWTLKYFGHDNVSILNGGTQKWAAEKRPLVFDKPELPAGNFTAHAERTGISATAAEVEQAMKSGVQLVDARTAEYYVGQMKVPYVYAKGHIPGSHMMAHVEFLDEKTKAFKSASELRKLAVEVGLDPSKPSISYCNSGHLGSSAWFVASELLGNKDARLFDGSMHEWTKDASRPVTRKWENP